MSNSAAGILIISMLHAYVFAILFFTKRHMAKTVLGLYMLNIALEYFLLANLEKFEVQGFAYLFYFLTPSITLNTIPLIYIYVRHMTSENYRISWKSLIHFIPSFIFLIAIFIAGKSLNNSSNSDLYKGELKQTADTIVFVAIYALSLLILFAQIIGYSIHMFILLYKHSNNVENIYSSKNEVSLQWLKIFVIIYLLYSVFEIVNMLFLGKTVSQTIYYSIISLHVFFVGFMGLRQKNIYTKKEDELIYDIELNDHNGKDNARSVSISDELTQELKVKLEDLMITKRIYLNEELSLYDVAKELKTNKNYLSYVINSCYDKNFFNYINEYRIEEAKKMLMDSNYDNLSIEGIAKSVGFKSRGVFYPVFKKITGKTPLEFKNDL